VKTRGTYFVFAGASAIIAALAIADYGDGAQDRLFVVLGIIGAVGFLIQGVRAGKSKGG
jgi:hypothetical protein